MTLKSGLGYEIRHIDIRHERFLVARTAQTLLLGDLLTCRLSELPWTGTGDERFDCSHPEASDAALLHCSLLCFCNPGGSFLQFDSQQ
jgi:hypothetical protein